MKKISLAILFCLSVSSLWAQGRLIGRVFAEDGTPVAGATVSVSGQTAMVAISNAQGYYVLLDVPQGNYEIKATKRGQPVWKGTITIASGVTQRVDVRLGGKSESLASAKGAVKKPKETEKPKQETVKEKEEEEAPPPVAPVAVANPQDLAKETELQKAIEESEKLNQLDAQQGELPETEVEIVGGIEAIQAKIEYPMALKRAKIEGTVVARVFVDEEGNPLRISLVQPANKFLNEEVIRVLTEETKFKPAKIGNSPVRGAITIPVRFRIQ
ncbi:MAG: TonB family protein [Chloroherpetonaceae bacterium]|nr:TonB family protein [Chloroherpetonaceae bacterium]MDW8438248.1 TonB family protein [Chloroherpetonaceae bacterium]